MRDQNGERLFPGDRVQLISPDGEKPIVIIKGPIKLNGGPAYNWVVRVRLGEMGYLPSQIMELNTGKWWPAKKSVRLGTTFEAAEKSFSSLLEAL